MEQAVSFSRTPLLPVLAARLAILASATATGLLISLHALSPEFSPAWRMVSEYADGKYGWVLSLMFAAYGLSSLSLAAAISPQLTTRRGQIGVVVLTISGIGQASAAVFDLNQQTLHELAGILGIVGLPIGAMLISVTLAGAPGWTAARKPVLFMANLTWVSVVVWVATFILMIATFIRMLGGLPASPPDEVPPGVIALVGWTNRLMLLSAWAWVTTIAWQILKLQQRARADSGQNTLQSRDLATAGH